MTPSSNLIILISVAIVRNTAALARRLRLTILAIAEFAVRIEKLATRTVSPRFREALAVRFLARAQKVARLIPRVGDCFAIEFTRRQPITLGPIA